MGENYYDHRVGHYYAWYNNISTIYDEHDDTLDCEIEIEIYCSEDVDDEEDYIEFTMRANFMFVICGGMYYDELHEDGEEIAIRAMRSLRWG